MYFGHRIREVPVLRKVRNRARNENEPIPLQFANLDFHVGVFGSTSKEIGFLHSKQLNKTIQPLSLWYAHTLRI
jgi:hypothetical protein